MTTINESASSESRGRIIPFRSRARLMHAVRPPMRQQPALGLPLVQDVAEFERRGDADDYRQRMLLNALALAFTIALIVAGLWLADAIATMQRDEDCALTGRSGCSPIEVPLNPRR